MLLMKSQNMLVRLWLREKGSTYVCLVLILLLSGCVSLEKIPPLENTHFLFITPSEEETFETLAKRYLGDVKYAARIKEFNGLDRVIASQEVIIPLQSFRPGGLTANGYQLVPVLAYHHFSRSNSNRKMIVGETRLEQQLRYLQDNGYYGITIDQFFDFLEFGQVPEKSVLITIDDGWESTYSIAYPLLKKYNYPAVLYIPTNHIREQKGRFLSWDQIRSMLVDETIDIQPHTKTHRNLTERRQGESFSSYINAIRSELGEAKHIISNKLAHETTSLSYPYGAANSFVIAFAELEGYTTGFTVKREGNPFFQNNFDLNRAMIFGGYREREFVKNIDIFESLKLEESEPIDESLNLAQLDFRNSEKYENQGQWRTAHMAWKIYRDWLVSELNKKLMNNINVSTKEYEQIKQVEKRIMGLRDKTKKIASEHYYAAIVEKEQNARFKGLLRTLLYDPKHKDALQKLKVLDQQFDMHKYLVKPNDSLKKISRSVYKNEYKSILIPIFNTQIQSNDDLTAGMILNLPKKPRKHVVSQSNQGRKKSCGQVNNSNKSKEKLSQEYYTAAMLEFNNGKTSKAVSSLDTSLCFNPGNLEAREMKELLDTLLN